MRRLDPRIHFAACTIVVMDRRVKPGDDSFPNYMDDKAE
jgi:hypothetical protein